MSTTVSPAPKRLNFFERYLSLWVLICMVVGVALGKLLPGAISALSKLEFGQGSQVNVPIAVLIWLMIFPMTPFSTPSGLMMDSVRSMAMVCVTPVGGRLAPG